MGRRHVVTGVTLLVLLGVLVVMAVVGFGTLTAPFPALGGTKATPTCSADQTAVRRFVRRPEVTVSVFNAGGRKGLAQRTLDAFEAAGFRPGQIGNADAGLTVRRAQVRVADPTDPAALLVAASLGKGTPVIRSTDDGGAGVDVFVGNRFDGSLAAGAVQRIRLPRPEKTCVSAP